jgi:hypothetical protein
LGKLANDRLQPGPVVTLGRVHGSVGLKVVSDGRTANHIMATTNPTKISIEKTARPVISIPSNGQDDVSHLLLRFDVPRPRGVTFTRTSSVVGDGPLDLFESKNLGRPVPVVHNGSHVAVLTR